MKTIPRLLHFGLSVFFVAISWAASAQSTNTAIKPVPREITWIARHEGFLAEGKQMKPQVVFLGDSITDGWRNEGKTVWDERFAPLNAANFGIDGDRTQHVLWRIQNGEFDSIKPKVIVLMIGTNNTPKGRNTPSEVIEGITAIVRRLRVKLPATKILLLAIFPRAQKGDPIREQLREINTAIAKLDDGQWVKFLDINSKFLEIDGTLSKEIMPDLLHPNPNGYRIWADAIRDELAMMMK